MINCYNSGYILQADLHEGEAAAIAQAEYKQAHLLIDENKGFKRALVMQITTTNGD